MATRSGSVSPSNSSDSYFRAWGKWISDSFSAFGWVQTSDTGQVNWATVTYPTTTWTSRGYEIWRMNDSLQSTYPVFAKIEYGSAGTATIPWIRLTIGTGSDGAGNITGIIFSAMPIYYGNTTTASACYASGSTNRIAVHMFKAASQHWSFAIERTHDASGGDSNVGVMVFIQYGALTWQSHQCNFTGSNPQRYAAWNHSQAPPSGSGAQAPDIHVYPVRCWTPGESFPSLNYVAYVVSDYADGSTYSITGYDGVSRTYLCFNTTYPGNINAASSSQQAVRHMMRYD